MSEAVAIDPTRGARYAPECRQRAGARRPAWAADAANAGYTIAGERAIGLGAQLRGVPVDDPVYRPPIVAGRWLRVGDGNVVVINQETAERNDIRLSDRIIFGLAGLGDSDWEVVGFYQLSNYSGCPGKWQLKLHQLLRSRPSATGS